MPRSNYWPRCLARLIGICMLLLAPLALATDIRIAAQQGSEPKFLNIGSGTAVGGLCVDILRAIEQLDPSLSFVGDQHWMPLTRMMAELSNGQQDAICGMQHTHEHDGQFVYLDPPLYPVNYMLMARADDPIVINNWDDLRKLSPAPIVVANRGFAASTVLENIGGIQIDASSANIQLNLQKLIAGRARLYFHRGPGIPHILSRAGVSDKIKILPVVMLSTKFYFVMSKHVDPDVIARVQRALAQLEKNGQLAQLYKKWD